MKELGDLSKESRLEKTRMNTPSVIYVMGLVGDSTDSVITILAPVFALGLAVVHLFSGRLRFVNVIPRSRWLSMAGGVSVAYVFIHILPEIQTAGGAIERSGSLLVQFENHVYLIALVGLSVFYGLERFVRQRRSRGPETEGEPDDVFWLHIGFFAMYNALIGYLLLHRERPSVVSLAMFFVAMALHFFVNDYGLHEYHGRAYHQYGRWVLAGGVILGLLTGYVVELADLLISVLFAFLAGGVILNVMKEELPSERQSRFWPFAAGAVTYTILLLSI